MEWYSLWALALIVALAFSGYRANRRIDVLESKVESLIENSNASE